MATNLVSTVMQFLTPDLIGRIAAALGLDRSIAQTAIGAAVPGLLAAFGGAAAQPGGAQKLLDAAKQEAGTLGNFTSMLGTKATQTSFADRGAQMLASLVGDREQNALAGAVSKFAGLDRSAGGSLLGILAPVVMGTIAQQGTRPADASGIASLLADQKDNVAAALPSGFGSLLGGTGILDSLGGAARTATAMGSQTARAATSAAYAVAGTGQRAASTAASASYNWLYWLIPLLAIAGVLLYLFGRPAEQVVQTGVTTAENLVVGGLDIGRQVGDSIGSLRTTLNGITDAASAQAALPKLREVTGQIDKVDSMLGQMSVTQRSVLTGIVKPLLPALNLLFDKVLAIPGVADVLKPTIDSLRVKLTALAA
jgi:hypothetical protein